MMVEEATEGVKDYWLVGGGEMGDRIRSFDWSQTSVGPIEGWSQSLRTIVSMALASSFPMLIFWGPDPIQLYNDAYIPIPGRKHPDMLGARYADTWSELRHIVDSAILRKFIPILLVTAHEEASATQGLDVGANDFIRKPIDADELLARVGAFLR